MLLWSTMGLVFAAGAFFGSTLALPTRIAAMGVGVLWSIALAVDAVHIGTY